MHIFISLALIFFISSYAQSAELWKSEKVIWIDDFVTSLSPVYFNRRKPLPTKEGIVSTSRNAQYSKVKESKVTI